MQALTTGNSIQPAGNADIGNDQRLVTTDSTVDQINDLLDIPLRRWLRGLRLSCATSAVSTIVGHAGGYALVNGKRTVYIPVTKRPDASTITVVNEVRQKPADVSSR